MSVDYDDLSETFQARILALMARHPEDSLPLIDPSYFTSYMHSQIAHAIQEAYRDKDLKKVRLTNPTLRHLVVRTLKKKKEIYLDHKKDYLRTIRKLFKMKLPDHAIVLEQARTFALGAKYREALVDAEKLINAKKYDEAAKRFDKLATLRKRDDRNQVVLPIVSLHKFVAEERQFDSDSNYLIHPIVPVGGAILLYGLPKELKSWMAAALAIDAACGRKALGFFHVPKPVKTLYLQVEDPEFLTRDRLRKLREKQGFQRRNFGTIMMRVGPRCGLNLLDPEWLAALTNEIAESKPKLVIFDVFRKLFRGNVADSKETAEFLAIIDKFRDMYGCAVLMVHHAKKGETSEIQTKALGSINLTAWADTLLFVSGKRLVGNASVSKLQIESKAAINPQKDLILRVDEDESPMVSVLQESKFELGPIVALITREPGLNQTELQQKLKYPENKLRGILKKAVQEGTLRQKRGSGKTLCYSIK
jgi:AAA domain